MVFFLQTSLSCGVHRALVEIPQFLFVLCDRLYEDDWHGWVQLFQS